MINPDIYAKILDDKAFLDALWNQYDVTDKYQALVMSGWTDETLQAEWLRLQESMNPNE